MTDPVFNPDRFFASPVNEISGSGYPARGSFKWDLAIIFALQNHDYFKIWTLIRN
jgi:hypothetical protein